MNSLAAERSGPLGYEVFISDTIPLALPDLLPDGSGRTWAPVSTTLIHGAKDAVLVDPPLTTAQATRVGDWVQAIGKRLTHILATHAHGDHWFTAAMLQGRFPEAQVVATAGAIRQMHRAVEARAGFWDVILPGQIPESPVTAVPAEQLGNRLPLEGHELIVIDVGHSDTDDTSVLHVPELELAVAGDVVYNGVHQFLVESGIPSAWHHVERHANNPIEADHSRFKQRLRPMRGLRTDETAQVVIAGHAFIQNLRRGYHELAADAPPALRVAAAFTELAQAT